MKMRQSRKFTQLDVGVSLKSDDPCAVVGLLSRLILFDVNRLLT